MFEHVVGLSPEAAARWSAWVEKCQPVLAQEGMEAAQRLLADDGATAVQAIAVTRALLGWEKTPLRMAIETVGTSAAWAAAKDRRDTNG